MLSGSFTGTVAMGWRERYRCDSCRLEAMVGGGEDLGCVVRTQTRYCPACQAPRAETIGETTPSSNENLAGATTEWGLCRSCKKPGGVPWLAGSPCPKCGGVVRVVEGCFEQWC